MCISKNRGRAFDLRSPPQQRVYIKYAYIYISSSWGVAAVEISSRGFLPYTLLLFYKRYFMHFTRTSYVYEVRGGCFFSSSVTSFLRAYDKSAPRPRSRFMYLYPSHILRDARAEATVGITAAVI